MTKALGAGGLVAVRIDNRPGLATIPGWAMRLKDSGTLWYDWWHYGGIVRDVALVAQERAAIRRQEIRPLRVEAGRATVATRVFLERFAAGDRLTVDAQALEPSGRAVARAGRAVEGAAGATVVPLELTIPEPQLWHFDRPNLYRMIVRVTDAKGAVVDRREEPFGIRTVEVRDRGLWLNGERVRLTGITRHEESTQEGLAETRGTMKYDWDDMKALHVVFTRPVHYPQHPYVLDYADRNGVLLVPEIPMWQFSEEQMKDPKVLALAKRMMQEMIEQAGNHPSVFAWSVCNESATSTPGGRAYVKAMVEHVKSLDPGRFVSYADDGLGRLTDATANANQYTDFLMMNQYFGSWHGPADGLAPALDRLGKLFPDKMVVISEFGLAGPFAADTAQADALRVATIREPARRVREARLRRRSRLLVLPGLQVAPQPLAGRDERLGGDGPRRREPAAPPVVRRVEGARRARRAWRSSGRAARAGGRRASRRRSSAARRPSCRRTSCAATASSGRRATRRAPSSARALPGCR